MNFLKKTAPKKIRETLKIAADFETVVVNDRHYVFAAGYKPIVNRAKTRIVYANSVDLIVYGMEHESNRVIGDFISGLEEELDTCGHDNIYVYFHNLNGFDQMFLVEWIGKNISDRHASVEFVDKGNKLYQLSIKHGKIRFVDSLNIANSSLDKLGWDLLRKNKLEIDHSTIMGSPEACIKNKSLIKKYLVRDVELLAGIVEILDTTFQSMDLCITRNITASSLAFQLYKQKYYKNSWEIEKPSRIKYDYIEKAYYGGLVMINKPMVKDAKCYDVNSMYPSVMLNNEMPLGKGEWFYNKTWEWIKDTNRLGFVDCNILITRPGLPYRKEVGDGLISPTGEVRGIYTTEELKFHEDRGATIKWVHSSLLYPNRGIIFKEFVNDLHSSRAKAKSEGNEAMSLCIKLLMNGAYGKFGTKNEYSFKKYVGVLTDSKLEKYKLLFNKDVHVINDTGLLSVHYNREDLEKNISKLAAANIDFALNKDELSDLIKGVRGIFSETSKGVQIAAFTTSYARIDLLRGIDEAIQYNINMGKKDCEVVYTDTDSIIINGEMPNHLLDNNLLGKYKEETDISEAIFLGPKSYMLRKRGEECTLNSTCKGCKRVMKGIPRQAIKEHTTCKTYKSIYNNAYNIDLEGGEKEVFIYKKPILRSLKTSEILYRDEWHHTLSLKTDKFNRVYEDKTWVSCEHPKTIYENNTVKILPPYKIL